MLDVVALMDVPKGEHMLGMFLLLLLRKIINQIIKKHD